MMKYLTLILILVSHTANAQMPMTTENRSLGPGTYEEATSGNLPPSDGYRKGWQSSKPSVPMSGAAGSVPVPNPQLDVPDE